MRSTALLLFRLTALELLETVTVPLPEKRNPAVLFVEVLLPLIPTEVVLVLVNLATTVPVGMEPGDQLPADCQAPPPAPCHVLVVTCACVCGAASNASAAMSNRSIRRSGDFVFMGFSAERGWQWSVCRGWKSE